MIVIDGCPLTCAQKVLAATGIEPVCVVNLHERGLKKRRHRSNMALDAYDSVTVTARRHQVGGDPEWQG